MRWKLHIFFLLLAAGFCFTLLTAVTDYASPAYHPALNAPGAVPAGRALSMVAPVRADAPAPESVVKFDPLLAPLPPVVFVPPGVDPVFAQHERERAERAAKNKLPLAKRIRYDEGGWYREEVALVTAYCPCARCCGTQSPGITSTGKNAWTPGLAADPVYLDYGTRVFVPGYGLSVIDDTGGAMRRHWRRDGILHIDLRMTYHYEAQQWGKKYNRVKIYEN